MYKVEPYIWQYIKEGQAIFQTQKSTTVITNSKLCEFLIDIEEKKKFLLNREDIEEYFEKANTTKIIDFLLQQGIFRTKSEKNINIERIVVLSNDLGFTESMKYNLDGMCNFLFVKKEILERMDFKNTDILLVFLNPFELKEMERLVSVIKEKDILCKFIFSYSNKIYFSNIYKKSWYNPCPLCFFYEIESQLRGEEDENNINFQTIIDLMYAENIMFQSNLPLDKTSYLHIIYYLSKYIYEILDDYKIDEVLEIDLSNYSIKRDIAYHWGYCDCYE